MTTMAFILTTSFMLGALGLSLHRTHLVSALLCLEGMMLAIFTTLSALTINLQTTTTTTEPIILLTFSACEASTGLALLVATARTHATDHLKTLNLLQC